MGDQAVHWPLALVPNVVGNRRIRLALSQQLDRAGDTGRRQCVVSVSSGDPGYIGSNAHALDRDTCRDTFPDFAKLTRTLL